MSFREDRYYVVSPTPELLNLARQHHIDFVIDETEVWHTVRHGRTGNEDTLDDVRRAIWNQFVGGWSPKDDPAPETAKFYKAIQDLGPSRCWEVRECPGGEASDLVAKGQRWAQNAADNLKLIGD